jgi:hypothetical protein
MFAASLPAVSQVCNFAATLEFVEKLGLREKS